MAGENETTGSTGSGSPPANIHAETPEKAAATIAADSDSAPAKPATGAAAPPPASDGPPAAPLSAPPPGPENPPPGNDGGPTTPPPRNGAIRRMGKKPPRHDHRTLQMKAYLPTSIAPPPASTNNRAKVKGTWGMMLNDKLGDCTGAAAGHAEVSWAANNDQPCTITDQDVEEFYEGSTGYNPDDPTTDQGGVELDVLIYWRNKGIAGKKIKAFVALEPKNHEHVQQTVFLFGGCYIGLALPLSAQDQDDWEVDESGNAGDPTAGSWGGHAVWVEDYDADWLYVITWGEVKRMSWRFWNRYCDESYAVLAEEAEAPASFDYHQLEADLAIVGDPITSADPETAAAEREDRAADVAEIPPHDRLTVKVTIGQDGGEVVATNLAGLHLAVAIALPTDAEASPDRSMVTLRLLVGGQGQAVGLPARALMEFGHQLGELFQGLGRRTLERARRAPPQDEGDPT